MKRFVLRWSVLFIAANVFGFVVHGLLLQGDYAANPQLLRTQEDANRHFVYMPMGFAFRLRRWSGSTNTVFNLGPGSARESGLALRYGC
jgi:hypothetical protein